MQINSITGFNYNKNLSSKTIISKKQNAQTLSFEGGKGAGIGSALGTAGVAWLGLGALVAAGPLAVAAGLLAGCAGGSAIGHGVEELADKIKNNNNSKGK